MLETMSVKLDGLVEKTYQSLLSIVQTTAVSRRVLQRPPFTFLHKLLVETLEQYGIFDAQQLEFAKLVSKEDKAAFLTRALAFVSVAMSNFKEKTISVLLLVSPVKVLAGVSVEDTHEFLQQLCVVCKSTNVEAKENAAREVLAKGDAQLYTTGVTFRRGLMLIQAIIRAFISRRVGKRKAGGVLAVSSPVGLSKASQFQQGFYSSGAPQPMVGTKFLKELPNGRVYDGVIVAVRGKRYTLRYEQDSDAEDDVDEIEMKILLEESVRLYRLRERIRSPRDGRKEDDAEISLTSLPDLTPAVADDWPRIPKRHSSSREFERLVSQAAASVRPSLTRSMSTRQSVGSSPTKSSDVETKESTKDGRRSSSGNRARLERIASQLSEDEDRSRAGREDSIKASAESKREDTTEATEEKLWQASLKQLLSKGQADRRPEVSVKGGERRKKQNDKPDEPQPTSNNMLSPSNISFPELMIPGKRKLPAVQKRKQPTAGFESPGAVAKPRLSPSAQIHLIRIE